MRGYAVNRLPLVLNTACHRFVTLIFATINVHVTNLGHSSSVLKCHRAAHPIRIKGVLYHISLIIHLIFYGSEVSSNISYV